MTWRVEKYFTDCYDETLLFTLSFEMWERRSSDSQKFLSFERWHWHCPAIPDTILEYIILVSRFKHLKAYNPSLGLIPSLLHFNSRLRWPKHLSEPGRQSLTSLQCTTGWVVSVKSAGESRYITRPLMQMYKAVNSAHYRQFRTDKTVRMRSKTSSASE